MKIGYLKPGILLLVLLFSFRQDLFAKKRITSLKCEYIEAPLGLDVQRPRLMWKVDTSDVPSRQTAYRILVSSTPELLRQGEADIWDSGKQKSDEQLVSYAGSTLRPHTRYWWRVEVWLMTAALEAKFGVPAANASILRTEFLTADKRKFE